MLRFWVLREINSRFCSKTQWHVSDGFRPPCWCPSRWAQAWRLHTNLYEFGENVSPRIFHNKSCCDLNLGESFCISTFFLFSDSRLKVFPIKPWTPEKISWMFIVLRPVRCEMKPQKITAKPQHWLVTTSILQVSNSEIFLSRFRLW